MTGGIVLGIGLCFHDHAPQQTSIRLAFHQPAANQLRGNDLRWTAEEGVGQGWEILGSELGGYGSGLEDECVFDGGFAAVCTGLDSPRFMDWGLELPNPLGL